MATAPKAETGEIVTKPKKKGKVGRPTPTPMQAQALDYILQGMKPGPAMRKAGYTEAQSKQPGRALLRKKGAQTIIQQHRAEFLRRGITPDFIGQKMKQWLDAEKKVYDKDGDLVDSVPDYQTQLKAYQEYKKDMGLATPQVAIQQNNQYNIGSLADEFALEDDSDASGN